MNKSAQASGTRRRIGIALIIEDNPTRAGTIAGLLDDEGYSTHTAESVAGARERLAAIRPDVVILDLTLSDGFGDALLADLAVAKIPTVIVSTFPLARLVAARHSVEFIAKPFDLTKLLESIERARRPSAAARTA